MFRHLPKLLLTIMSLLATAAVSMADAWSAGNARPWGRGVKLLEPSHFSTLQ